MDNIKQWLMERKIIYSILALFYDGNVEEALEIIKDNQLLKHFANYQDNKLISNGSMKLIKEIEKNKDNNNYIELILDDYQKLFVGPDEILAPLWESVYKTKDKLLFGDIELNVRRYYNSIGLDVKKSEAADYLPFQLSFMSHLCIIAEKNSLENIRENLEKQRKFLVEHLLSWISLWIKDVDNNARIKFWMALAEITKSWLENDLDEIKRLLS